MIRLSTLPTPRAGVLVLGPTRQDDSGISYRAWSPGEGDAVALWIDARRIDDDPFRAERLARQAFALERVRHPNLAEVIRFDDHGGRLAVVERTGGPIATPRIPDPDPDPGQRPGPPSVRRSLATVLQAARGVQALHERGLIHGDIRPDSLAVLDDGRVVLTGLGRVAPPPEDPEATEPPSSPDPAAAREDLDGLGRTFYALVTGTPAGPSADPADTPPPESINPRVPAGVSEAIRRLMLPESRGGYPGIGPAVADLERLAGAPKPGEFLPRAELVDAYRSCAIDFAEAPAARLRRTVLLASTGGTASLAVLSALIGLRSLALGLLGLMAMTAAFRFVVGGVQRGGPLFDRARRLVAGGRVRDLATVAAAVVLAVLGLVVAGLLGVAIALGIVAAILAGLAEVFLDRPAEADRRDTLDRAAALLRDLRLHGLAEPGVRAFAVDHGGERWGPLFLALFGFDAYREALARRGVPAEERLLRVELAGRAILGIDARLRARRDERDRGVLTVLEERRLKAAGVFELTARRRSWRIVPALLARARAFEAGQPLPAGNLAESLAEAVRNPEGVLVEVEAESPLDRLRRRARWALDAAIGPRARLLAGLLLLVGFLAWAHQNELIRDAGLGEFVETVRTTDDPSALGDALQDRGDRLLAGAEDAEALRIEGAPSAVSSLFRHAGAGVAALILLASALGSARWLAAGAIAAAGIALLGPDLGIPLGASVGLALVLAVLSAVATLR